MKFRLIAVLFCMVQLTFSLDETNVTFCERPSIASDRLIQLTVITRHGARSPIRTFPNDIYQENAWPDGFGQLLSRGISDQFQLGRFFRLCYFNDDTSQVTTKSYSTDYDRTIMSANSFNAGFLTEGQSLNLASAIHDILKPVHTLPESNLHLECDNKQEFCDLNTEAEQAYKKAYEARNEIYDNIAEMAGLKKGNLREIEHNMADAVFVERYNEKPLVEWLENNETLVQAINDIYYMSSAICHREDLPECTRSYSSPFLKFLKPEMENAVKKYKGEIKERQPQLLLISAHDSTISSMLAALGQFDGQQPPYSSALILETSVSADRNNLEISVFFKNSSESLPHPIYVRNCGYSCPVDTFFESIKDAFVFEPTSSSISSNFNYLKNALWRNDTSNDVKAGFIAFIAFTLFALILIIASIISKPNCNSFILRNSIFHQFLGCNQRRLKVPVQSPSRTPSRLISRVNRYTTVDEECGEDDDDEYDDANDSQLLLKRLENTSAQASQPLLMSP